MLIAWVYEHLRSNDLLDRTMLIITYDEHGGFYDHVPPPKAVPPVGPPKRLLRKLVDFFVYQDAHGFRFDRLGVRVPTVIVSARVPKGPDETPYDHSSLPRTLRAIFRPDDSRPLSAREQNAEPFDHLAVLNVARTDLPDLSACVNEAALFGPAPWFAPTQLGSGRNDPFMQQLREKEALVAAKLQARVVRPAYGPLAGETPLTGAQLLTLAAEQARGDAR